MKINTPLVSMIKTSLVIHRKAKYCINMLLFLFYQKNNKKVNISQTIQFLWCTDHSKEKEVTKNITPSNVT